MSRGGGGGEGCWSVWWGGKGGWPPHGVGGWGGEAGRPKNKEPHCDTLYPGEEGGGRFKKEGKGERGGGRGRERERGGWGEEGRKGLGMNHSFSFEAGSLPFRFSVTHMKVEKLKLVKMMNICNIHHFIPYYHII